MLDGDKFTDFSADFFRRLFLFLKPFIGRSEPPAVVNIGKRSVDIYKVKNIPTATCLNVESST